MVKIYENSESVNQMIFPGIREKYEVKTHWYYFFKYSFGMQEFLKKH